MSKLERYIIGSAVAAIIIFLVWFFSNIVVYILISAILSLLGKPLVDILCKIKVGRLHIPRWISATVVVVLLWAVTIFVITFFIPVIGNKIQTFTVASVENFRSDVTAPLDSLKNFLYNRFGYVMTTSSDAIIADIYARISILLDESLKGMGSLIDFVTSAFISLFSITFITFFFLKESDLFNNGVVILFPPKYEKDVRAAIDTSVGLVSRYFIGLSLESTIKIIVITLGLYFMGFDFATSFTIAVISGILNVIPYIGPMIGIGIGLLLGLTSPVASADMANMAVKMTVLFLIFQVIDNIILQPYIYSNSVKAHPLEIFLVILIAGSMAGIWGMLLAIPAYTVLRVFAKIFLRQFQVVQKLTNSI